VDGVQPTPSHAVLAEEDSDSPVLQNESFINTTQAIPAESVELPSTYDSDLHSHAGNDTSTIPLLAPVPSHPAPVHHDDDVHQRETFGSGSWKDSEGPGRNSRGI